jgi:outer membrane protein assembly factor BamB
MSEPYFILLSTLTDNTVKVADSEGEFLGNLVTSNSGGISGTDGLALGDDGNLYLGGVLSENVLRYNALTGSFIDQFAPDDTNALGAVTGIEFGPDGNLYVSNFDAFNGVDSNGELIIDSTVSDNIQVFDGESGELINTFEFPNPGPAIPVGLNFDSEGNLYVASRLNDAVYRYNTETGELLESEGFINSADGGLDRPADLLFGPDGNIYVTSLDSDQILRYNAQGDFIDVYAQFDPATELDGPTALVLSPDRQELIVTGFNSANAARLDFATGEVIDVFIPVGGNETFGFGKNDGLLILTAEDLGIQPEDVFGTTGDDVLGVNPNATNPEQFFPTPKNVFADLGDDLIDATVANGGNTLYGEEGNDEFFLGYRDTVIGGEGDDSFFVISNGNNTLTGGAGADAFWLANAEIVDTANIITDFDDSDVIGIGGLGISSTDGLGFTQDGNDVLISVNESQIARVLNIEVDALNADGNFVFA